MKKVLQLFLGALFLFVTLTVGACKSSVTFERYKNADLYTVGSASFANGQVNEVEIYWLGGMIEISQNKDGAVRIAEDELPVEQKGQMRYYLSGTTLKIQFCASGFRVEEVEKNLHVSVPVGVSLDIECVSARVSVLDSLELTNFSLESKSGSFEGENIVCRNEMEVETLSGNVEVLDLTTFGALSMETTSGNISVGKLSARLGVEADTVSGKISFGLQIPTTGEIETTSGNVRIKLLGGMGGNIAFDSAKGQCRTEKENIKTGNRYTFLPREGKGACNLTVETFEGDLTIE